MRELTGSSSGRQSGFTLLEILAVMVVIALTVALAQLSLSGGDSRRLENEARRLFQQMRLAEEEAVYFNRPVGLYFFHNESSAQSGVLAGVGYQWLVWQQGQWRPVTKDAAFSEPGFLEGVIMSLTVAGENLALAAPLAEDAARVPQIFFTGSGEDEMFSLILVSSDDRLREFQIQCDAQGQLDFTSISGEDALVAESF